MSKAAHALAALTGIFLSVLSSHSQEIEAAISILPSGKAIVRGQYIVSTRSGSDRLNNKNLSFLREAAGVSGLGGRISKVELFDAAGKSVGYKNLMPGEFLADGPYMSWSYEIDLNLSAPPSAAAHISWLSSTGGVLMLDDLLPQNSPNKLATIRLQLPESWRVSTLEKETGANVFETADLRNAIFILSSKTFREISVKNSRLRFITSDSWQFTDEEAAQMAAEIYAEYKNLLGIDIETSAHIYFAKFTASVQPGIWEAETRGRNVLIFSSDMPSRSQSLQRLHEQLRHEIFHLWIPNSLNLSGNYDWFYEGFILYQSLKTGVKLKRIRFVDFLDTLSRAYKIDSMQTLAMSLIDASRQRWLGNNTQIYARGMLAAFLIDVMLLEMSRGKKDIANIFRELLQKHGKNANKVDGNTAVVSILGQYSVLLPIVEKYIKNADKLDWKAALHTAGLHEDDNSASSLKINPKLSGRQKDLLRKLGYNR